MRSLNEIRPNLNAFASAGDGEGKVIAPMIIGATTAPGNSDDRTFVDAGPKDSLAMDHSAAIRRVSPTHSSQSGGDTRVGGGLSRCSSIDSDTIISTNISLTISADWSIDIDTDAAEEFHQPLSPSIMLSPNCVRNQSAMNGAVSSTMERVAQLHSFLSETSSSVAGGGGGGGGQPNGTNIRRVGSQAEDSVGQESARSNDSLDREEAELNGSVEEMKREMECVDRLLLMQACSTSSSKRPVFDRLAHASIHSGEDSQSNLDEESSGLTYIVEKPYTSTCMPPASPRNCVRETCSFDYKQASPSGVADVLEGDRILGKSVTLAWDSVDDSVSTESHLNLVSKSLQSEFDAVSTTCSSMDSTIRSSGGVASLQGSHEYAARSTERKHYPRTLEGGLCVTASVAFVLAIWLRRTDLVNISEQQFLAAIMVLPPLVTLLETKLPHRIQETSMAFGILVGGTLIQRMMAV